MQGISGVVTRDDAPGWRVAGACRDGGSQASGEGRAPGCRVGRGEAAGEGAYRLERNKGCWGQGTI